MADLATRLRRAGPEGWIARAFTRRDPPTPDLYLANACADWLAEGRIRRMAPTVFASAGALLVLRHDARTPAGLARPRTAYLIDDAWAEAGAGSGLSAYWRLKTAAVEARAARHYLARATDAVASSPAIAAAIRRQRPELPVHLLHPHWSEPLADLAHHEGPGLDIAFLGAALHASDLAFLLPALPELLAALPEATFAVPAGHALPPGLATHPRVRRLPGLRWPDWRRHLPGLRFHLALYPLRPTALNAARSVNKLIEHAVTGAVTLASPVWAPGREAAARGAALVLPDDPGAWVAAVRALAADRARLRAMAAAARAHAAALNDPAPQRALWSRLLLDDRT